MRHSLTDGNGLIVRFLQTIRTGETDSLTTFIMMKIVYCFTLKIHIDGMMQIVTREITLFARKRPLIQGAEVLLLADI